MSPTQHQILLVDDHDILRRGLRAYLQQQPGCTVVGEAQGVQETFDYLRSPRVAGRDGPRPA
jgi:DNA-binding NarL/FixJ family response regulator